MIELRSDTFTLPTDRMREAIATAELGDDVYDEDPTVAKLEALAADRLGMAATCLLPSGTMANLAAMLAHCPRGAKVVVGADSDIYVYEAGGASICGGLVYAPVPNERDGTLAEAALEAELAVDATDPQFALPGLVCLENTHNRCGGKVLPLDYLARMRELTLTQGLPLHLDGARVFNAATALGVGVHEITRHVDSVQFCLSKGLSAPIGSILGGSTEFIARARRYRKMLGGGMRQAGLIAAAGIVAIEEMADRLHEDHEHATRLAEGLRLIDGIELDSDETSTNIVMFRVDAERYSLPGFLSAARERGVSLGELGHGRVRAVTHRGVTAGDVDRALETVARLLAHH